MFCTELSPVSSDHNDAPFDNDSPIFEEEENEEEVEDGQGEQEEPFQNGEDSDYSSDGKESFVEEENSKRELVNGTIQQKLRNWATSNINCITRKAIDELLLVFRSENYTTMPLSSKTFFKSNVSSIEPEIILNTHNKFGEYKYVGIEKMLNFVIDPNIFIDKEISLLIHIDGVTLYNKTKKNAWTILGKVNNAGYDAKPFLLGLYYGEGKPKNVVDFLMDLVKEINHLTANGVTIKNTTFSFKIDAFVCDTPARAYIKQCKGHTGFCACERCVCHGLTVNNKRVFCNYKADQRTHSSFRQKSQPDHHSKTQTSPLLLITNLDIIKNVVLDPMHLLYHGVAHTLLRNILSDPECTFRLTDEKKEKLQTLLNQISRDIPCEFQRDKYDIGSLSDWKATQFRFFLLYASGVVLQNLIPSDAFKHFSLLYTALRILSDKDLALQETDYVKSLLLKFFRLLPTFYGPASQILNFHNLLHITDDVSFMQRPLEDYSAFAFENYLGLLKKLLKSSTRPLSQILTRIHEFMYGLENSTVISCPLIIPVKKQRRIPVTHTETTENNKILFDTVKLNGMTLKNCHPDNIVLTKNGEILRINHMFIRLVDDKPTGKIMIRARKMKIIGDVFEYPVKSQQVGIFHVEDVRNVYFYSLESVYKKCILTKVDDRLIVISLLH